MEIVQLSKEEQNVAAIAYGAGYDGLWSEHMPTFLFEDVEGCWDIWQREWRRGAMDKMSCEEYAMELEYN